MPSKNPAVNTALLAHLLHTSRSHRKINLNGLKICYDVAHLSSVGISSTSQNECSSFGEDIEEVAEVEKMTYF